MAELNEKDLEKVSGGTLEIPEETMKKLNAPVVDANHSCPLFLREDGTEQTCAHCFHAVVSGGVYYCIDMYYSKYH